MPLYRNILFTFLMFFVFSMDYTTVDAQGYNMRKTIRAQLELNVLYNELAFMCNSLEFKQYGMGKDNKSAIAWKKKVETLRDKIQDAIDIPEQVRNGPENLLQLSQAVENREHAEDLENEIINAINLKP